MTNSKLFLFALVVIPNFCRATLDFSWDNDVIRKYSRIKVLNSCLGESFVKTWEESMRASTEKCFSEDALSEEPTLTSLLEDILLRRNYVFGGGQQVPSAQHPLFHNKASPGFNLPKTDQIIPHSFQQNPYFLYLLPHHPPMSLKPKPQVLHLNHQHQNRLWKRSTVEEAKVADQEGQHSTSDRSAKKMELLPEWRNDIGLDTSRLLKTIPEVKSVKKQLANRISNITCVLKSMELLDERGTPNYNYNTRLINQLNIPETLRSSLLNVQDFCREFSMCVPVHRLSNTFVREVGYSLVFLKCMKKMVLQTCILHDMQANMPYFDVELPFLFPGTSLVGGRASYANRGGKLFEDTPEELTKHFEQIFSSDDEVAFGF